VTVIEIPVLVMLAVWFVGRALFAAADLINPTGSDSWLAYVAQLGGFAFGLLTIKLLATRRKAVPPPRPVY
jgi:membrane associated rhomboid family serine protease